MENSEIGFKEEDSDEFEELVRSLPKERELLNEFNYYNYQGFWILGTFLKSVLSFQKNFVALNDDILLASCPKSGTTWLKALSFSIVNRHRFHVSNSPLITSNPHTLVPKLEVHVYGKPESIDSLNTAPKPRLFSSSLPYPSLPVSIRNSNCKIVYICRNPLDQFVSSCYFISNFFGEKDKPVSITEESFDQFYRGVHLFGPFWDHVLEFWKASLERPHKILFVKYEDLKKDGLSQVKQLAGFLGFPFSEEEEKQGIVKEIINFCSIDNMKSLKGNVEGKRPYGASHTAFFRKGEVRDWVNHLTPFMAERIKNIIKEKYEEYDLHMFWIIYLLRVHY